ncbi:MAG TPA: cupredoxin family protein [Burkholderiaceae bacterium]|nr:cupredoxin family protein [Burkholderiaceae bacterium]
MNTHTAVLALALATLGSSALAHGPQAHRPTHVIKEQKPWGIAAEPGAARRTITIAMDDDMRFKPDVIDVREGETVRLAIRNRGKLLHELVIGTQQELDDHAALMVKFPGMQHDEPYMAHVDPGKRGEIVWTFNRPGEFKFACLIAGHYQAGMVGTVRVQPASKGNL